MKVNIPISLIVWSISNRKVDHLQLFFYLKNRVGDYIISKELGKDIKYLAVELGVSERTFRNRLKSLKKMGWVWESKDTVHLLGRKRILQKLKGKVRSNRNLTNVNLLTGKDFKNILIGSVIKYISKAPYVRSAFNNNGDAYKVLKRKGILNYQTVYWLSIYKLKRVQLLN